MYLRYAIIIHYCKEPCMLLHTIFGPASKEQYFYVIKYKYNDQRL